MDSSSEEESEWTNEFDKSFKDQLNQYKDLYLEKRTKFREEKQELENTIKHLRSQNSTHQKGIQMRDKEIESVKEESEKKQKEQEEIIQNLSSANLDLLKKQNQLVFNCAKVFDKTEDFIKKLMHDEISGPCPEKNVEKKVEKISAKKKKIVKKNQENFEKKCGKKDKKIVTEPKTPQPTLDPQEVEEIQEQRQNHMCIECDLRFDVLTSLQSHLKLKHNTIMKRLPTQSKPIYQKCPKCGKEVRELNKHLSRVHQDFDLRVPLKPSQNKKVTLVELPEKSDEKPSMSYKQMVAHAIMHHSKMATLSEIHQFIQTTFPYFADKKKLVVTLVEGVFRVHKNCFTKEKEIIGGKSKNTYRIEWEEWEKNKNREKKSQKTSPKKSEKKSKKNSQKKSEKKLNKKLNKKKKL